MKTTIKLTDKYLAKLNLPADLFAELPEDQRVVKRISVDQVYGTDDEEDHYAKGIISTVDPDSDGDVVMQSGLDYSRYMNNPVVLFNHDLNNPVGYCDNCTAADNYAYTTARTKFGTTPEATRVYQLLKDKVLRTFSIGFVPMLAHTKGTAKFRELLDNLAKMHPERFTAEKRNLVDRIVERALVIEYSVVTVPANEYAVLQEIKHLTIAEPKQLPVVTPVQAPEVKAVSITRVNPVEIKRLGTADDLALVELYKARWGI